MKLRKELISIAKKAKKENYKKAKAWLKEHKDELIGCAQLGQRELIYGDESTYNFWSKNGNEEVSKFFIRLFPMEQEVSVSW